MGLRGSKAAGAARQIVLDLHDCMPSRLDDIEFIRNAMTEAARRASATIVQSVFHKFAPCGVSGVVVIAESHLAIHTWPERNFAAVDLFTCGDGLGLKAATDYLIEVFQSKDPQLLEFQRGARRLAALDRLDPASDAPSAANTA